MRLRKRVSNHPAVVSLRNKLGIKQYFGQNQEDKTIAQYFGDFKGTLLSIGENDGITYSNALHFILNGWSADLVEPSQVAFSKVSKLHRGNNKVAIHQVAIGEQNGEADFYDSGQLEGLGDTSLVSSLKKDTTTMWTGVNFNKITIKTYDFQTFNTTVARYKTYDFITIDAELMDLTILKQMDLTKLGCKCLIIEHGGEEATKKQMIDHCTKHGLSLAHTTQENFIFTK
ncbi:MULTISPECIES: FkbM family methyltransferase [Niastella]|uniref:FkbM family methyltransferase n=1 Tax=Niastella soli TaxID=2821487 RepID=A0ABS3Z3I5_9BACT|nr:FkbM family methyltransferase [Niastella soli]MBO9204297.1 FkbM family methyltransferase [Niastella soli]